MNTDLFWGLSLLVLMVVAMAFPSTWAFLFPLALCFILAPLFTRR